MINKVQYDILSYRTQTFDKKWNVFINLNEICGILLLCRYKEPRAKSII